MAKTKEPKTENPEKIKESAPEAIVSGPKWIKVTAEQLAKLQEEGKLAGYRPDTNEALIK